MYDEYLGESHGILRNTVRRFVEREIAPFVDRWEREKGFPRELYQKAGEAGFFGIGSPEAYGGTPCDIFHEIVVVEEMIRCGSVGLVSGLFCSGIAMPPIVAMGSEDQKERFLPPIIRGETIAVLGVTEPSGGSDVANLRTRAVRDGDHYIVNGSKTFITSGVRADLVTAAVRTGGEGAGGISLLLIERGTPGFTVSKNIEKMGWHASDTAELSFIDCQVPRENLRGRKQRIPGNRCQFSKGAAVSGGTGPNRGSNGPGALHRVRPGTQGFWENPHGVSGDPPQAGKDGDPSGGLETVQLPGGGNDWKYGKCI